MKIARMVAICMLALVFASGAVWAQQGSVKIAMGKTVNWDQLDKMLGPVKASKRYTIGAIEKTLINEHWQEMAKGYQDEAKALGVNVEIGAARTEASLTEQLDLAETMLSKNYSALCVSPLAETNLVSALQEAASKKIPIVNVDDARVTSVPNVFVGANHKQMGVLAGEYFAKAFKGKGPVEVALIEGMSGSSASIQRVEGFKEAVGKSPDLKLVASRAGGLGPHEVPECHGEHPAGAPEPEGNLCLQRHHGPRCDGSHHQRGKEGAGHGDRDGRSA